MEDQNRIKKEVDMSKNRAGFYLREQGIGDTQGKVLVLVWRGEEFVNGEIWLGVGGKENVGYVV